MSGFQLTPLPLLAFAMRTLRGFRRNQGLLLAGAIAYYALLSLLPLLILSVVGLSHLVERGVLLDTIAMYLDWLLPSLADGLVADIAGFLDRRTTISLVMLGTLLFFSSLAFSVLEKAMAVIFVHRGRDQERHALVSAILPYSLVIVLGIALLLLTLGTLALQTLAGESLVLLGQRWSLSSVAGFLFPLLGVALISIVLAAIYLIVPVGRTRPSHALLGGLAGALLWEVLRHGLIWYFATISKIGVVYGSLATAVVLLFFMELAAVLLLLGAQVIAELEQSAAQD
jgi:YihY family inner membrane protein